MKKIRLPMSRKWYRRSRFIGGAFSMAVISYNDPVRGHVFVTSVTFIICFLFLTFLDWADGTDKDSES